MIRRGRVLAERSEANRLRRRGNAPHRPLGFARGGPWWRFYSRARVRWRTPVFAAGGIFFDCGENQTGVLFEVFGKVVPIRHFSPSG
jgi:hypothetical protein